MPAAQSRQETATEVGTAGLLVYFKRFMRPYALLLCGTVVLSLIAVTAELLLPQIVRSVIDSHLTITARRISPEATENDIRILLPDHAGSLVYCTDKPSFFLLPETLRSMGESEIVRIEEGGLLSEGKYYTSPVTPRIITLQEKYPDKLYRADTHVFIAYDNLQKLDSADLHMLRARDAAGITRSALLFLLVLCAVFLCTSLQIYLVERGSQHIMHDIRTAVYNHVQSMDSAFFHSTPVGRLVTRTTNDIQNLHEMVSALFANIIKDVFIILGIMIVLCVINWKLFLVCFSVFPPLIACSAAFSLKSRKAFRQVRITLAAINSYIQENLSGLAVVKSFLSEARNEDLFRRRNEENYAANMRQTVLFAMFNPLVDVTQLTAIALIVWYGGGKSLRDVITVGTLVVFLHYMRMFFRPVQDLAEKYNIIQSAFASLERIYLILHQTQNIPATAKPFLPDASSVGITFDRVSFSYNGSDPVLSNVSFSVSQGERVALVGLTGAGKTTIINLLERFYDVDQGRILLGCANVRDINLRHMRKMIGLVMQDVILFGGSIRSNVTMNNRNLSDSAVHQALRIANAEHIVRRFSEGLDYVLTEGAKEISSGERQLLSFARAIAGNPPLLVLDEATSSVDPFTESLIQDAMEKILHGRTCLIIAHRFSTIQKADKIIVLHKGRIRESGTHDELISRQGLYQKLFSLQKQ